MKRTVSLLVLVTAVSAFSAAAASLHVDAGVLQAWSFDVDLCEDQPDFCAPPDEPGDVYELEVTVWRMDGNSGMGEGLDAPLSDPQTSELSTDSEAMTKGPDEPDTSSDVAESVPDGSGDEGHVGPDGEPAGPE
jgi:hypothetical protein